MFTHAITRRPGENFAMGITNSGLGAPDYDRLLVQHTAYINTLRSLELEVTVLEALPQYPDAYFVEDPAVVVPELAILAYSGAPARRGEQLALDTVLARFRPLAHILPPGTLDGGDVLQVEKHFFIGVSERTNLEGASQLGKLLAHCGYSWTPVPVAAGLHFKSSVNYVGKTTLLVTPAFASRPELNAYQLIVVDSGEEYACNTLLVNGTLITPAGFPSTRQKLEALDIPVIELDCSEARKMDGGLTCMSLRM